MATNQTDLSGYLAQLFGKPQAAPQTGGDQMADQTDQAPSGQPVAAPAQPQAIASPSVQDQLGIAKKSFGSKLKSFGNDFLQGLVSGVNPNYYAQQQENLRQHAMLAAQQQNQEAQQGQQSYENQFRAMSGIASGALIQVAPGTPGSLTASSSEEGQPDLAFKPNPNFAQRKTLQITPDSEIGKRWGLTTPLNIGEDEYGKLAESMAERKDLAAAKAQKDQQNQMNLDAMQADAMRDAVSRFSPARYDALYGRHDDPDRERMMQDYMDQIKTAVGRDRSIGQTTQLEAVHNRMNSSASRSPWELNQEKEYEANLQQRTANAKNDILHPDPSPADVKLWTDAMEQGGTKMLMQAHQLNPKLGNAVETEFAKRGGNLFNLTNEEQNTRDQARILLPHLQHVQDLLNQPGMADAFGPAQGRWQDFLAGKYGSMGDSRWKEVSDNLSYMQGLAKKIHYGVRGAANEKVGATFDKLFNADKMDLPTLQQGMRDLRPWMESYATEGQNPYTPPSVQNQLGLGAPAGATPAAKIPKFIVQNGQVIANPNYKGQ